jgi:hypothetical protein
VTVVLPALLLKRLRGIPVLFWVQDLWPESLSATGMVRTRWILSLVERMVRFIYRHSDRILIQSQAFRGQILRLGAPQALAAAVLALYDMPKHEREELGVRGRAYFEAEYERGTLLQRLSRCIFEKLKKVSDARADSRGARKIIERATGSRFFWPDGGLDSP